MEAHNVTEGCCDEWWHTLLTSPPQTFTAEQVREHFNQERNEG